MICLPIGRYIGRYPVKSKRRANRDGAKRKTTDARRRPRIAGTAENASAPRNICTAKFTEKRMNHAVFCESVDRALTSLPLAWIHG
jgi:hypothetical protein